VGGGSGKGNAGVLRSKGERGENLKTEMTNKGITENPRKNRDPASYTWNSGKLQKPSGISEKVEQWEKYQKKDL